MESQGSPLGVLAPSARSWGVLCVFEEALWGRWHSLSGIWGLRVALWGCWHPLPGFVEALGETLGALQALGDTWALCWPLGVLVLKAMPLGLSCPLPQVWLGGVPLGGPAGAPPHRPVPWGPFAGGAPPGLAPWDTVGCCCSRPRGGQGCCCYGHIQDAGHPPPTHASGDAHGLHRVHDEVGGGWRRGAEAFAWPRNLLLSVSGRW